MIRRPLRRHRAASVTVLALVVVLLAAVGTELTARGLLHSRLAAAAGRALGPGSDPSVDVSGGPALFDLYDRHVDAVTVSSAHATVGRVPDVSVRARLDDVRLTGRRSGTVARTHADVDVPAASLRSLAGAPGSRLPVTGVRTDARTGTLTLDLQGGLGRATLRPGLRDGRVSLRLVDAEILGNPAPAALVERIQQGLTDRTGTDYPLGLSATALDVTATGLTVTLDGGPARFAGAKGAEGA